MVSIGGAAIAGMSLCFSREICVRAIFNGSLEFIGEISMGITRFAYNFVIMRRIGVDGVTAFTIVGYPTYAFSMIIVGFGQGASPLFSFCYGTEEKTLAADIRKRRTDMSSGSVRRLFC